MPSILEISAASFGRRASNSSATRGRPPVMSLVLAVLRGVLAISVPATNLVAFFDDDVRAGRNRVIGQDFLLLVHDDDLRMQIFLVFDDDHGFLAGRFVHFLFHRHAFDDVVEFNFAAFSERIGTLYGSHCTKVSPFFTSPPSATEMTEPMTML